LSLSITLRVTVLAITQAPTSSTVLALENKKSPDFTKRFGFTRSSIVQVLLSCSSYSPQETALTFTTPVSSRVGGLSTHLKLLPVSMSARRQSTLAHTHPSGSSGKSLVSGCTGSGYFFCQSLGWGLPCSANLASCLASQWARRASRMRSSSWAPVSCSLFCWRCVSRQSAVSAPSTAAFSSDCRYCPSFFCAALSSATPASRSESSSSSFSTMRICSAAGAMTMGICFIAALVNFSRVDPETNGW